jgi:16S rRNA (cytidine1402-2'-O)-methyltransferase
MAGTLYVVATPIGNLEDISFRALRTLRDVDLIAAEDTRRTSKLLAHYEIRRPLVSLHAHNEFRETPRLVARLQAGESIALVSDAGTPGIADPGARLVRAARDADLQVIPIPGPSAVSAALSASGLAADQYVFLGFPPATGAARQDWLNQLKNEPRAIVFFEAPHRIRRTLEACRLELVKRQIFVCREISKLHEEYIVYHNQPLREQGEFVVVIEPGNGAPVHIPPTESTGALASAIVGCMTEFAGVDGAVALEMTARALQIDPKVAAKIIKKYKYAVKRQSQDPTRSP